VTDHDHHDRDDLPIDPDRPPARVRASVVVAVAVGGALGAPARYGVARLITSAANRFPWATFWTNVSGSFALGVVVALVVERFPSNRYARPFLAIGFLGAYTTYSTFAVDTDLLLKNGHAGVALVYVVASMVVGLAAATIGIRVGEAFVGTEA
jgi:CrcB protein